MNDDKISNKKNEYINPKEIHANFYIILYNSGFEHIKLGIKLKQFTQFQPAITFFV